MPLPPEPQELPRECEIVPVDESTAKPGSHIKPHEVELDKEMLATLSAEDKAILAEIDMDGSGKVELTEILGLLRQHKDAKGNMGKLFKVFAIVVALLVGLLCINTASTFMVIEMTKESKVKGTAMTSASTGKTVDTENTDMSVDADGKLLPKKTVNSTRRLAADKGAIKTNPSLQKVELASSLPDSTLMGLDELTVYSDKGHTLQITVHGFSRVPVLNSKCGNVVHFYTAWKGRITLDSKDMSFDEDTAKEFKNAGFSLGVGGIGGRRLAGKSKTDSFFKHMEDLKASGKWKCAGVPLPQMADTNIHKDTYYQPCGTKASATNVKLILDLCDSRYGGYMPGTGNLPKAHALASLSKAARVSAMLKDSTPDVVYVKYRSTMLRSKKYQVTISSLPNHVTQEQITIFDRASKASVTFQIAQGGDRTHCVKEAADLAGKALETAAADTSVDSDMHFEFVDTNEEGGKVLRHFRMMASDAFNKYMGAGGTKPKDGYTEYWDMADTLTPYRILSGDGKITLFDSMTAKCTDADIEKELSSRTKGVPAAELFQCSDAEKNTKLTPTMTSAFTDLDQNDEGYYTQNVFGTRESLDTLASDVDDKSEKANFARYLKKTYDPEGMPDFCYQLCKDNVDTYKQDLKYGVNTCTSKSLPSALNCLANSGISQCQMAPFIFSHFEECGKPAAVPVDPTPADATRRLGEEDELEDGYVQAPESLVPIHTKPDGTQEADLSKAPPQMKAQLAKHLGMKSIDSARLLFNATKEHQIYSEAALDTPAESRRLFSTSCNSKLGAVTWMGDGWCMKWEFKPKGFTLSIKWGNIAGAMGVSITCQACVNLLEFWAVPPPLKVDFCVGGSISITAVRACPDIPLTISGKVYWSIEGVIDLSVLSISLAKLEVGILAAIATFNAENGCWWVSGEGRRRRRWWSSRRRNWRACHYKATCDLKVGGYIAVSAALFKVQLEEVYWVKGKCMTVSVTAYVYEFWLAWWGGWKNMYSTEVMRYYF